MNWLFLLQTVAALLIAFALLVFRPTKSKPLGSRNASELSDALADIVQRHNVTLPSMFVDSEQLNRNIEAVKKLSASHGKTVRVATKVRFCNSIVNSRGHEMILLTSRAYACLLSCSTSSSKAPPRSKA
jgi:hypothetical protein